MELWDNVITRLPMKALLSMGLSKTGSSLVWVCLLGDALEVARRLSRSSIRINEEQADQLAEALELASADAFAFDGILYVLVRLPGSSFIHKLSNDGNSCV